MVKDKVQQRNELLQELSAGKVVLYDQEEANYLLNNLCSQMEKMMSQQVQFRDISFIEDGECISGVNTLGKTSDQLYKRTLQKAKEIRNHKKAEQVAEKIQASLKNLKMINQNKYKNQIQNLSNHKDKFPMVQSHSTQIVDYVNKSKISPMISHLKTIHTDHSDKIISMLVLDYRHIATSSLDKTIKIWDTRSREDHDSAKYTLRGNLTPVSHMRRFFTKDSMKKRGLQCLLLTAGTKPSINFKIWTVDEESASQILCSPTSVVDSEVSSLEVVDSNNFLVGCVNGMIYAICFSTLEVQYKLQESGYIRSMLLSIDKKTLIFSAENVLNISKIHKKITDIPTKNQHSLSNEICSIPVVEKISVYYEKVLKKAFISMKPVGKNPNIFIGFTSNGYAELWKIGADQPINMIYLLNPAHNIIIDCVGPANQIFALNNATEREGFKLAGIQDDSALEIESDKKAPASNSGYPALQILGAAKSRGENKVGDQYEGSEGFEFANYFNVRGRQPNIGVWRFNY